MCESCDIAAKYDRVVAADELIAKALNISELTMMAKREQRLREFIDKIWESRRVQASVRARNLAGEGKTAKVISAAIRKIMSKWSDDILGRYNKDTEEVYKLARIVGLKKAKKKVKGSLAYNTPNFTEMEEKIKKAVASVAPSFDLADEAAIDMLKKNNTFWIGEHYDRGLADTISSTTSEVLAETGTARRTAAILMAERVREALGTVITPGGFHGSSLQYFEGLTANTMTVARVFGQMRSFGDVGITRYTINNPQDSRTCKVCSHMDQKTFEVKQGYAQMEAELAADSPEDIKRIHPWLNHTQLRRISPTGGRMTGRAGAVDSRNLSAAGIALPPFHFRCRCTVDIDPAVASFDDLAPVT